MKNKQLYIAYGSNINLEQMAYRCPHSKVVGTSEIKDYELEFRGVATIVPKKGATVPILIWELDERDLPALNRYEGYPRLYRQEKMSFGTKVHQVLEQLDFKRPNLEGLNNNIKDKIIDFLNTELIKENIEGTFYPEYEFIDSKEHTHGIMDLVIEQENKMIIIDYKLKNIDDDAYDKQLNGYREFLKQKTKKDVDCYLYSIIDGIYREVKEQ